MSIIDSMVMPYKLLAQLMYGGGLRVSEALRLRVKDVDFAMGYIVIRDGKGFKDRTTLLPKSIIPDLKKQIDVVKSLLEYDKACGVSGVYMPNMLEKKYPSAGNSLGWQFIFPSNELGKDPGSDAIRRHHIYPTIIQSHVKQAIKKCACINILAVTRSVTPLLPGCCKPSMT